MASPLGIDLGNAYRTAEAIKQSKFLRGVQEADMERSGKAREAAAAFVGGDNAAYGTLMTLDPKMANEIITGFNALDKAGKDAKAAEVDAIGSLAAGILSAPDPAKAYAQTISELPEAERGKFPPTYDENWVKAKLAQATEISDIFDKINGDAEYARDRTDKATDTATAQQNALELVDANANADIKVNVAKNVAEGGGTIESADSSLLFRMSAELLGGVFDQQGNLTTLDPNARAKAQEIATRASKYFGTMSHAEAVKKAAQELGISFPGDAPPANVLTPPPAPANADDPAGLFN
jgi:hypothetical protein